MKELRLDFPDYPAAEQEKDAERAARRKETEIYVMKVNGAWGRIYAARQLFYDV